MAADSGDKSTSPVKVRLLLAAPTDLVGSCLDQMAAANVGSILVVVDGRPVSIFTERDVLRCWRDLAAVGGAGLPISRFASQPVFSLQLKDLSSAPAEMVKRRIRHVPVVDEQGQVLGVVSMRDVLAAQQRANTLPKLQKAPANLPPAARGHLHLVAPTSGLVTICQKLLPGDWECRTWGTMSQFTAAKPLSVPGVNFERTALLLDLDGLGPKEDWRPVVKELIQLLTHVAQPKLFLVASPNHYGEHDQALLKKIAEKAHWHVYQRPLPVTALAHDFATLNDLPTT